MMRIPLSLWGEKLRQRLLTVCQFAFPPDTQSWATFLKFLCHFVWPYNWIVVSQCGWKRFCYNRFCPWKSPMWFSTFPLSPSSGWLLCQWWWELYLHAAWSSTAPPPKWTLLEWEINFNCVRPLRVLDCLLKLLANPHQHRGHWLRVEEWKGLT